MVAVAVGSDVGEATVAALLVGVGPSVRRGRVVVGTGSVPGPDLPRETEFRLGLTCRTRCPWRCGGSGVPANRQLWWVGLSRCV